jgi:hypothetical protein
MVSNEDRVGGGGYFKKKRKKTLNDSGTQRTAMLPCWSSAGISSLLMSVLHACASDASVPFQV